MQRGGDPGGCNSALHRPERLGGLFPEGQRTLGGLLLLGGQLRKLGGQPGLRFPQIICTDLRAFERFSGRAQLLFLPGQGVLCVFDPLFQLELFPAEGCGGPGGFVDLDLQQRVLLFQVGQLVLGRGNRALLLLIRRNIGLGLVQLRNLAAQLCKLGLRFSERAVKAAVHLGIQDKINLVKLSARHQPVSLRSAITALFASIHFPSSHRGQSSHLKTSVWLFCASTRHSRRRFRIPPTRLRKNAPGCKFLKSPRWAAPPASRH